MITIRANFKTSPGQLFEDWLNSQAHGDMTGGVAECSPLPNAEFTAWDGYIEGVNLELVVGEKILQTWRTAEFDDTDEDSLLEITLTSDGKGGCDFKLVHERLPAETSSKYESGWMEHYIEPMTKYYQRS